MNPLAADVENVSVQTRDLRRSFYGQPVLKGITFDVKPGEIFVIIGPSGSGKTLLLKHIIGLEQPDSGQVLIQGQPVESPQTRNRFRIAMVFQSPALLNSLTVGENVGLYLSEHQLAKPPELARQVAQQLQAVGLEGLEDRPPSELSSGMQKRVAIARALIMRPQLILLDEPTAELDPLMAAAIAAEIIKLKSRTHATSIIVTHDRTLAFNLADRVAMLSQGQLIAIGTPGQIQHSSDPPVRQFVEAQMPHLYPPQNP